MKRLVARLSLLLTFSLWLPAVCGGGFTVQKQKKLSEPSVWTPPSTHPSPDGGYKDTPTTTISSWSEYAHDRDGIDFLVAVFFFIAAGWLVLAVIYSILVVIVVRLRARGHLDVYDENFGRLYLLGNRCYIPLGCLLRRYVISLNREENGGGDPATVRLMTREERRMAMELLLSSDEENVTICGNSASRSGSNEEEEVVLSNEMSPEEIRHEVTDARMDEEHGVDDSSSEEPVCTICLAEYEPTDVCFTSTVCSHRFHHGCIMDWLERRANTECPCCRTRLISDEEVWETVQKIRGERRRQIRKANRGQGLFPWFRCGSDRLGDEETIDPSPPPSPYRSFESGNVDNDAERDRVVVEENGLRGRLEGRDS